MSSCPISSENFHKKNIRSKQTKIKNKYRAAASLTVKASNFVILLGENIFLWQTFLWLLHDFFRYWSLYSNGLGIAQSHFGLGHFLGLKNSFFRRVTNLGDRLLISSPSPVFQVNIATVNRGCYWHHCFCDGKTLWTLPKQMTPCRVSWMNRVKISRQITKSLSIHKFFSSKNEV